jgi:RNA polymerase sigma factor (sigma-70 family)
VLTALPDQAVVAWVSANVIPYEAELRQRLRRICASAAEVDDLVQDVYCRLLKMETVAHVGEPRAFLMQIAKNIIIDRLRRDAIVHIYAVADLDELAVADSGPSPERVALARSELKWVLGMVAHLPERCRQVFRARKIQGLSQHDTAITLGVSENIVEKETIRGLKLISDMVSEVGIEQGAKRQAGARAQRRRHV